MQKNRNTATCALIAFVGLVSIQVCIGILYKFSQQNGKYPFSQASSLCLSEACKCIMSLFFYARTLGAREGGKIPNVKSVFTSFRAEVPHKIMLGFYFLSAFYALNNNTVFYVYKFADPGTITLIKSASTFITAGLLWIMLGKMTSLPQWIAIIVQVMGLIIAQYDECKGQGNYSFLLYLTICSTLLFSTFNGALNEFLIKSTTASLNALNVHLYFSGAIFNLIFYLFLANYPGHSEPAFFYGYGGLGFFVVLSNAFIGVAITAVYKYADGVVKGLANSTSTAILLGLSAIFAWAPFRAVSAGGCLIIFMATYIYFTHPYVAPVTLAETEPLSAKLDNTPASMDVRGLLKSRVAKVLLVIVLGWMAFPAFSPTQLIRKTALQKSTAVSSSAITSGRHFKDILLVADMGDEEYEENIDAFHAVYDQAFPNIVFFGPEIWRKAHRSAEVFVSKDQGPQKALYLAMKWYPKYAGYLLIHQRTFLNISNLASLDKKSVWSVSSECQLKPTPLTKENCDGEQWWCGSDNNLIRCKDTINNITLIPNSRLPMSRPTHCHFSEASIAYIPAAYRDAFALYTEEFMRRKMKHEIILPTVLSMLGDASNRVELIVHRNEHGRRANVEEMDRVVKERQICGKKELVRMDAFHPVEWRSEQIVSTLKNRFYHKEL